MGSVVVSGSSGIFACKLINFAKAQNECKGDNEKPVITGFFYGVKGRSF
jgi:hypothetical protein